MSLPVALTPGTLIGGHYIIGNIINLGGFGAVYRGVDTSEGNRPCAIKETYDVTPAARRQALMEASVLFTVRSPHLPEVYDALEANGRFYLIMQLIEGQNLLQLLRSRVPGGLVGQAAPGHLLTGPCSEQEVLTWFLPLMDALQELHSRRPPVMHRDIKPGNIVLTPGNTAVLLDFGLTKLYDPNVSTQTLGRAVTEGFSPLEQYVGKTTPQSDIYSLGATMYILLTNRLPPVATSRGVRDELLSPRLINPSISPKLEWVLLKALALHADQRFQSMGEIAHILREPSFNGYNDPTISAQIAPFALQAQQSYSGVVNTMNSGSHAEPTVSVGLPFYSGQSGLGGPVSASYPAGAPQGYNQRPAGPYAPPPPQPQQSYPGIGPGAQQQMSYPGIGPGGPQGYVGMVPGPANYPYHAPMQQSVAPSTPLLPVSPPLTPAEQRKRARAQRPLPAASNQGCLWGLFQGLLAASLVLFLREQADFYLATCLGFAFYAMAGFITTRRGGGVLRGAWAGYWAGIYGVIIFWLVLGIGLIVTTIQRYQILSKYNAQVDQRSLWNQAWSFIQPTWPPVPIILANQTPFVNFLILMLVGLIAAWICGLLGGVWGNARYAAKNSI